MNNWEFTANIAKKLNQWIPVVTFSALSLMVWKNSHHATGLFKPLAGYNKIRENNSRLQANSLPNSFGLLHRRNFSSHYTNEVSVKSKETPVEA